MSTFWKWTKRIMAGFLILVLVLTVLTYAAGVFAKTKLTRENPPPGQLTDVGGYDMHLYCMGAGSPTVILEAGLNDFHVSWSKVQADVASSARVCSYDRAGMGWSEASPHPRTSQVMAEELHTLLKNSGVKGPYILVGHSFGGIVMRQFAQKYSDEVTGMVLVDSAHEEQIARLPFLKETANEFIGQFRTLSAMSSFGLMALSPATIPNRGFPDEAYRQYQAVLATTNYFDASIAESTAFYFGTPSIQTAQLGDLPLIVLSHGLPDATSDVSDMQESQFEMEWAKMQKELAGLSSQGKQVIAQKSGHYIQLDQPNLVIDSIRELLGLT
jgi:pimeloyl-ACP methyl ester carboxylesterase